MRRGFLEVARCPACGTDRPFALDVGTEDEHEVRAGRLTCGACGHAAAIRDGIVDLLPGDVPEFVRREAAGLERFADVMVADGWTEEVLLKLPYVEHGYWYAQATAM